MNREQIVGLAAAALLSLVVGHGVAPAQAQSSPPSPGKQGGTPVGAAPRSSPPPAPKPAPTVAPASTSPKPAPTVAPASTSPPPAPTVAPGPDPSVAPPPPAPAVTVSVGLNRQVTLTPAEQLAQCDTFLARMDSARNAVRRQLETARSQRDVVKTLCLNDKLTQIDVAIRSARERRQGLELAVNRHDVDLSTHEFTILAVLRQRTDQLTTEANQCIGQEAGFIGDSAVTSTIDPNLPKEDPSDFPVNNFVVEPPACSSCFQ